MKKIIFLLATLPFLTTAQQTNSNLVSNGSFETLTEVPHAPGLITNATGMSSANLTTVDLFSKKTCDKMVKAPINYMGVQEPSSGDNYAGILAYYGDETTTIYGAAPGYQRYSEYLQVELTQPLVAGQIYNIKMNISLAEESAFAISGLGMFFSKDTMAINNNTYLSVEPNLVSINAITSKDWIGMQGNYKATGGEKYLIFGVFNDYMVVTKVIPDNVNNSRKAYYYIDDISVNPGESLNNIEKNITLNGGCFKLQNLNFETNQAIISTSSYSELDALAYLLKTSPDLTVYVDGYTDKSGTDEINVNLSKDRANAVKTYLIGKGVIADNMIVRWYGSNNVIDNKHINSLKNRRVEITACSYK